MPASSIMKPQNLFGASTASNGVKEKSTHIEVCARIRPLQISMQSSSSYFGSDPHGKDSPRKPPIPSSARSKGGIPPPSSTSKTKPASSKTPTKPTTVVSPDDLFYAWDVVGQDTASQSPKTDIVQGRTHQYTLDRVYGPSATTKDVYNKSVKPLVNSAMEGYHSAVLAYGQTSTGKTFSMTGTPSSPGIIPLAIHQCFQCLQQDREYLIRVSYLEVYKEQIRDLLAEGASQIRLFDHREQGLIIKGLREEVVTCPKQIFEILAQGEKRRKIGATNMNQHSSRSHVMVRLWIESRSVSGGFSRTGSNISSSSNLSSRNSTPVRVSSLSLVDLAGSESVRLHGADEARRQEGHYINKSLMALGKVVYALSEMGKKENANKQPQHIPYRDSKLTRLLQPSLSGNAQMVLICCISPLANHVEESHNTFKFATRAKKVPQKATIQESADEKTLLQTYREEIEALKQQLKDAKQQQEALLQQQQREATESGDEDDEILDDEVAELKLAIQNMEHLILKSKAASPATTGTKTPTPNKSMSDDELMESILGSESEDENDEAALLALMSETQKSSGATRSPMDGKGATSPRTPASSDDMYNELHRIQGLLGSVLRRRKKTPQQSPAAENSNGTKNVAEVDKLRAQLEEQEVASSLRKADATFLQKQLEEKDALLAEVSKILEQVEKRQVDLEAENAQLKQQVAFLKSKAASPSSPAAEC